MMDDAEYSDLSDLDSEMEPSATRSKKSRNEYSVRGALMAPRATTYTTQALCEQIDLSDINLAPEYQRDVVWTNEKQINLIDSILRNFYVPPIIFAVQQFEDGTEKRTCIDGKQRLTSIYRLSTSSFMKGHIPHRDNGTNKKYWYKDNSDERSHQKMLLPPKYRTLFSNKQIVCVEYHDIAESAERDIFQASPFSQNPTVKIDILPKRVQNGLALTPSEKLGVISSPRSKFVRQLMTDYLNTETGRHLADEGKIKWDRARGSDFRTIATTLFLLDGNTKVGQIKQLEKWLASDEQVPQPFRDRVNSAMGTLIQLLDKKYSKAFIKYKRPKVAPVELVGIIYLISKLAGSASLDQLCNSIIETRDHVQAEHESHITLNDKVGTTIIEFVDDTLSLRFPSTKKRSLPDAADERSSKKRLSSAPSLPTPSQVSKPRPSLPK